ncbi:beta-N-acetylhexosaminidase [Streptomyces sp. 1114.5]|uniref:glycoside hydrolase family 3 N-terminal domain-containing protein n=1 Tax=unclassified Streptomyces TaxID=2593676 RepID=UPI000BCEB47C|nr:MULTISPECIES: glycoside hydrolase family 3 N-terminal domain-containing protein [unclassified Streptomyces]RKT08854.1 beta-N-acetylhexosaminidase [Streptomyces sp. 1114.5]SOB79182.1 beta-N-acetylhexosaminidase [Streptomyces sp. 1331.2]
MAPLRRVARFGVMLAVLGVSLGPVPLGTASEVRPTHTERTVTMAAQAPEDSRTLAGRRIVLSYAGPTPPPGVLQTIREGRAAGVILFGQNITGPEQLAEAVAELKQAAAEAPHPHALLLMTDQEGGKVRRLRGAPELSARRTGQAPNPVAAAAESGLGAARTLTDAGLNLNLAPVLDVFDTPDNFIDHSERSYSQDPSAVGQLGTAFLAAQQGLGVAATAKHFPGLGAAARAENTDERPVTLDLPLERIRDRDEAPYRAAIAAGVRLVMASWAVYPALDPERPAGLSPAVIKGELRDRLGFDGVTVTDAMEAGALVPFGDTGERAVAAAEAGMDLLLCSARDPQQAEDATEALAAALDSGRLDRAAFTTAVARIDALRASLD